MERLRAVQEKQQRTPTPANSPETVHSMASVTKVNEESIGNLGRSATFRVLRKAYEHTRFRAINDSARVSRWLRVLMNRTAFVSGGLLRFYGRATQRLERPHNGERRLANAPDKEGMKIEATSPALSAASILPIFLRQFSRLAANAYQPIRHTFSSLLKLQKGTDLAKFKSMGTVSFLPVHREFLGALRRNGYSEGSLAQRRQTLAGISRQIFSWRTRLSERLIRVDSAPAKPDFGPATRGQLAYFMKHSLPRLSFLQKTDARNFNLSKRRPILAYLPAVFAFTTVSQIVFGVEAIDAGTAGLGMAVLGYTIHRNLDSMKLLPPATEKRWKRRSTTQRSADATHTLDGSRGLRILRWLQGVNSWAMSPKTTIAKARAFPRETNGFHDEHETGSKYSDKRRGKSIPNTQDQRAMHTGMQDAGLPTNSIQQVPERTSSLLADVVRLYRSRSLKNQNQMRSLSTRSKSDSPLGRSTCTRRPEMFRDPEIRKRDRQEFSRPEVAESDSFVIDTIGRDLPQELSFLERFLVCIDHTLSILEIHIQRIMRRAHALGLIDFADLHDALYSRRSNERELLLSITKRDRNQRHL
jgi:hypothetical protein